MIKEIQTTNMFNQNRIDRFTVGERGIVSIEFEPCGNRKVYKVHQNIGDHLRVFQIDENRVNKVIYKED